MRTIAGVLSLIAILVAPSDPAATAGAPAATSQATTQDSHSACDGLAGAPSDFCPARQQTVVLPPGPSPQTVGWIDEKLEAMVDTRGRVSGVHLLEGSPGGSSVIAPVVKNWEFRPATNRGSAINSTVLVAAMFRPPLSYNGPTTGTPSVRLARPSAETPFPLSTTPPNYPALAVVEQAVVLVEVLVDPKGHVQNALLVRSAEGVNREALDAARAWSFRPAQQNGRPVPAYAYVIFGFHRPVTGG